MICARVSWSNSDQIEKSSCLKIQYAFLKFKFCSSIWFPPHALNERPIGCWWIAPRGHRALERRMPNLTDSRCGIHAAGRRNLKQEQRKGTSSCWSSTFAYRQSSNEGFSGVAKGHDRTLTNWSPIDQSSWPQWLDQNSRSTLTTTAVKSKQKV